MRIPSPYISNQIRQLPNSLPTVKPSVAPRVATESYNKQASKPSPQIIDAEFVEFYAPSSKIFNRELLDLDYTLASETIPDTSVWNPNNRLSQAASKYQDNEKHHSGPGVHLNFYT